MLDGELAPVIPRIEARLVPRVMELFLSRGARIETILYDPNSVHNGFPPLEIALDVTRWYLEREFVLSSTFQLTASLCLPRMADEVQDDEVEKDVALRLVEAGCRLKDGDFDFNIRDWMNSGDSSRSPIQYLGAGVPFVPPHLPVLPEWNFPSMNGIIPGNGYGSSRPTYPSKRTHGHVPKFNFRSYYSNSSDVPVKNRMKTMEQGLPKYLSGEKLPYISILIKKGKRSV